MDPDLWAECHFTSDAVKWPACYTSDSILQQDCYRAIPHPGLYQQPHSLARVPGAGLHPGFRSLALV